MKIPQEIRAKTLARNEIVSLTLSLNYNLCHSRQWIAIDDSRPIANGDNGTRSVTVNGCHCNITMSNLYIGTF